jgi:hypothetical protein
VSIISFPVVNSEDPSAAELADIELEWPLIAAELNLLDAQIAYITAGPAASVLDRRRVRRAERRVLDAKRKLAACGGAGALPCGCPDSVIASLIRDGGEQHSACGSTWDRNEQVISRRGIDGDEVA